MNLKPKYMKKIVILLLILSFSTNTKANNLPLKRELKEYEVMKDSLCYKITKDYKVNLRICKYTEIDTNKMFNDVVEIIKRHETIHSKEHFPYVGYGHRYLKTDTFKLPISKELAVILLKKDLRKKMSKFKGNFKTRLLLGTLSYNIGEYRLLNLKNKPKAELTKLLYSKSKDTSKIKDEYIKWCRYNGKVHKKIQRRRKEEFSTIFFI